MVYNNFADSINSKNSRDYTSVILQTVFFFTFINISGTFVFITFSIRVFLSPKNYACSRITLMQFQYMLRSFQLFFTLTPLCV